MRILFIRLGAIGDVIQAAAALRIHKDSHPEDSIDWMIDSAYVDLAQSFKVVDRIIGINSGKFLTGNLCSRLIGFIKAQATLDLKMHYDAVVTAHPDWRYRLLSLMIATGKRLDPQNLDKDHGFIFTENRTLEYFRLLNKLHPNTSELISIDDNLIDKAIANLGWNSISKYDDTYSKIPGHSIPSEYIALIPGGAKNTLRDDPLRRWPIESYSELVRRLISSGKNVVLLGGPDDIWVNKYFDGLNVINLIGKTTLLDMVFLLNQAQATICHDSGPLHIASITKTPLLSIFGPTPPSAIISGSRYNTTILKPAQEISCSPCYDGKDYAPCVSNICMQSTSVNRVFEKLSVLLSSSAARPK